MDKSNELPGALPELTTGLSGKEINLVPGEGFWTRIEQISAKSEMTRDFDVAMHGQSSPRIWLFLHEPGRGELSTAIATSFARELAFRDQAVLLLDCDDRDMALTRWVGRVEAEGWIDLARYGTSVLTSGVPMPFVGRRGYLLGVGSFAPTDVTGEEIDSLLTRLRRQADDLLLVAPADDLGRLWAPAAAIRIFCWDRQTMPEQAARALAAGFAEAGSPLTAMATFQEFGPAEELLVDEALAESTQAPEIPDVPRPSEPTEPVEPAEPAEPAKPTEPAEPVEPIEPVAPSGPVAEEADAPVVSEPDESEQDSDWRDLPLEREASAEDAGTGPEIPSGSVFASGQTPDRGTSRVFWFGALAALVLIAVVTVYYLKFVRVPPESNFGHIDVATEIVPPATDDQKTPTVAQDPGDAAVVAAGADSLTELGKDESDSLQAAALIEPTEKAAADSTPPATTDTEVAVREADIQAPDAPETATVPETKVALPTEFDMGPYREPVGAAGWAIHVYSLPDSIRTAKQVRELDRRGFRSAVRIFDLGAKGRWHRIYLGSFASKSVARRAMPALLEKLREDWGKPEKFQTSAPE